SPVALRSSSLHCSAPLPPLHSFPTRRSSDLATPSRWCAARWFFPTALARRCASPFSRWEIGLARPRRPAPTSWVVKTWSRRCPRSEEHTSELQSPYDLVCRLLLEKKKKKEIE